MTNYHPVPKSVIDRIDAIVRSRQPDFQVGDKNTPYMLRWHLLRDGQWDESLSQTDKDAFRPYLLDGSGCLYIHHFLRSDDPRALHDHPWDWQTRVIRGQYIEYTPKTIGQPGGTTQGEIVCAGHVSSIRPGHFSHRIELSPNGSALTLFSATQRYRDWGFWCPQGWRHWQTFTSPNDKGAIGRGCE